MPNYGSNVPQRPDSHASNGGAALRGAFARGGERATHAELTREFFHPTRPWERPQSVDQPYAQHSVTYACMNRVATNIAQVPFLIRFGDEESEDVLRDGPWVELFDQPCPGLSRSQFFELLALQVQEPRGESIIIKESYGNERIAPGEIPTELWPMSGERFSVVLNADTKLPEAWVYMTPDGKPVIYAPHELIVVRLMNPYDRWRGIGPGEAAQIAMRQDWKASRYNERFFDNDATPGGVLITQGKLTPEQRTSIRGAWENRHQGVDKRSRVAVLEGGLDYKDTSKSQRDMEFIGGRKLAWQEVAMVYGVPESELGLMENIPNASAIATDKGFWTKRLVPYMKNIEDTLWSELFRPVEGDAGSPGRARRTMNVRKAEARWSPSRLRAQRTYREYQDVRTWSAFDRAKQPAPTKRGDVWGEFDLSTIEALRDDFSAKVKDAEVLQRLSYPVNQINERLDLGMENVAWGDEQSMPAASAFGGGFGGDDEDDAPPEKKKPAPKKDKEKKDDEDERAVVVPAKSSDVVAVRMVEWTRKHTPRHAHALKVFEALIVPIESKFQSKFTRWLMEMREWQIKALAGQVKAPRFAALDGTRGPKDKLTKEELQKVLFETQVWGQKLVKYEHANYTQAAKGGIDSAVSDLGGNFAFDVVDPRVVDVIEKREKILLTKVPETIQKRVARSLEAGIGNGETVSELQDRLRADFNLFTNARARMVARTEVANTVNQSRAQVFEAEGVEATEWTTAQDEVVRDSHDAQNGDVVALGQPFKNGCKFPGDPAAPPGETINCRCVAIPAIARALRGVVYDAAQAAPKPVPPPRVPIRVEKTLKFDPTTGRIIGATEVPIYEDAP